MRDCEKDDVEELYCHNLKFGVGEKRGRNGIILFLKYRGVSYVWDKVGAEKIYIGGESGKVITKKTLV